MNPLTQIKNTQKATRKEVEAGISDSASWHARFKHSAYVFAGGLDYDLTEGDLLAVFAQYGEVVDLNMARNQETGKSKGFAFLAYEDQRSTVLAVDNLNGAKVAGMVVRVEHVDNYKKRKAELEDGAPPEGDQGEPDAAPAGHHSMPPPPPRGSDAPSAGARAKQESSAPWAAPGSIFSLLEEARQKERQDKAGKPQGGADDAPRGRSEGAGPGPSGGGGSFGPPRPPPRPPPRDADAREEDRGVDRREHHNHHHAPRGDDDRQRSGTAQHHTHTHTSSRGDGGRDGSGREDSRTDRPRDTDRFGGDSRRGYEHDRGGHDGKYRHGSDAPRGGGGSQPPRHDRDAYRDGDGDGDGRSSRHERKRHSPDRHKRRRSRSR